MITQVTSFNPHINVTSDGVVITLGLRVLDYDRREGTVVGDSSNRTVNCCGGQHPTENMSVQGCDMYCRHDHWFDVRNDEGQVKEFNGERLQSITEAHRAGRV